MPLVRHHRGLRIHHEDLAQRIRLGFGVADMARCTWAGGAVADIDYEGTFTLTSWPSMDGDIVHIDWQITLDAFPAFEGYVERDGEIATLFIVPPPQGNTVQDLLGGASRAFAGSVTLFPNLVVGPDA